jgi:hypothetical protein
MLTIPATLLCSDGHPDLAAGFKGPSGSARALLHCMKQANFAAVVYCGVFLPDELKDAQAEFHKIEPLDYWQWNRWLLYEAAEHVRTSHYLLIQWDGFIVNPERWQDSFLEWDVMACPWRAGIPHRTAAGGFTLRSRKFTDAVRTLPVYESEGRYGEDWWMFQMHNQELCDAGARIAPVEVCADFALDDDIPERPNWKIGDSFGVHNYNNKKLAAHIESIAAA